MVEISSKRMSSTKKRENGKLHKKVSKKLCATTNKEFESMKMKMDKKEIRETLKVLLSQTNQYIAGIKPKREWIANCHYAELKSAVQSLCGKIKQLKNANKQCTEECL